MRQGKALLTSAVPCSSGVAVFQQDSSGCSMEMVSGHLVKQYSFIHICMCASVHLHVCTCMRERGQIKDGISFPCQVGGGGATEIKNRGPQCGESGEGWKNPLLGDWLLGNVRGPSEGKTVEQ